MLLSELKWTQPGLPGYAYRQSTVALPHLSLDVQTEQRDGIDMYWITVPGIGVRHYCLDALEAQAVLYHYVNKSAAETTV